MSIGDIKTKLSDLWTKAKTWWEGKDRPTIKSFTPSIGSLVDKFKARWSSAKTWWEGKKRPKIKSFTPSIGSVKDKFVDRWKTAKDWWEGKKRPKLKSVTPSIGSVKDSLISAWNSAKKWWKDNVKLDLKLNLKVPTIKIKWEYVNAFGKEFKYPTGFDLKFAAAGGIFDAGSLIWAGERGPEIVANAAGGRTGVMNTNQMQDAVFEGVYAAVMAANRASSSDSSPAFNIYLDGKQITATVEKRQRERGTSIMGNQVYTY